ncbi:MAG TPA: type IX secretion system sortase PorU, partial [Salinivirga sp.]|uniref:type IX secretion system sortase PorU n=1 Tax=Salinivirga sp. TaxID=1970192 RepID=UPI002B4605B9
MKNKIKHILFRSNSILSLLIFFFIALPTILNGQEKQVFDINIKWVDDPQLNRAYFENCYYFDSLRHLPHYFRIIDMPKQTSNIEIGISNISLTSPPKHTQFSTKKIPGKIDYSYKIVTTKKQKKLYLWVNAGVNKNGQFNLLQKARVTVSFQKSKLQAALPQKKQYPNNSVLNTGEWRKIKVRENGIYKITYNQLSDWGFSNLADVRVYGFGGKQLSFRVDSEDPYYLPQVPIWMEKGSDGVFNSGDYILFYGNGILNRGIDTATNELSIKEHDYTLDGHYFITTSLGPASTINTQNYNNENHTLSRNTFTDVQYFNHRTTNLNYTGRIFFGEPMQPGEDESFNFNFPNIVESTPIRVKTHVGAICSGVTSYFRMYLNGNMFHQTSVAQSGSYDKGRSSISEATVNATSDEFSIALEYASSNVTANGYVGDIEVIAERSLIYEGNPMIMQNFQDIGKPDIVRYQLSNLPEDGIVWNISNTGAPVNVNLNRNGSTTSFKYPADDQNMFVAFEHENALTPTDAGAVENQNLHGEGFYDLFILVHPDFKDQAEELAQFHRDRENLTVRIVEPQKIYNEFSSGNQDASAIRNYLKMYYDRASNDAQMPKHLLLFGDGSYDNISESNNTNYIPTFQTDWVYSYRSVACDDFFVMLDSGEGGDEGSLDLNGTLDMGVGRFPVSTVNQAQIMVDKTIDYVANPNLGPWKNDLVFVGDDADGIDYYLQQDAYELATIVRNKYKWMNPKMILMDAYPQESTPAGERYPEVTKAINGNIHRGVLIFNYTGHGSETRLAHEGILNKNTVKNWTNDKLPFFVTGSCEVSRYDNKNRQSLGEAILLKENAGAITLFSTTRVVYGNANQTLSENLYNTIFEPNEDGQYKTLGEVIAITKNLTSGNNLRNFTLFGDPAVRLDVPPKRIITDSINGIEAFNEPDTAIADTLKALKKIRIHGHIADSTGNSKMNFNGTVYPVIYDKLKKKQTLNNDNSPSGSFNYYEYSNVIYKGKASVQNGEFSFDFIVPIDINYEFGQGKISYYAENTQTDAYGHFDNFIVGGSDSLIVDDSQGPQIDVYLNDTTFVSGGTTDESPLLIAHLRDEYGVNTTGNVIGHDLTATLNEDINNRINLNDFYENDLNSYQSGKVEYQLIDLDEGLNTIEVKAWDILNNSSKSYVEFYVANSADVVLEHVLNYPNPFTTKTSFLFEHNQANEMIDVRIQIFTISGKLIKTLETSVSGTQYMNNPIVWDGRDDFGDRIGRGVYIYKVRLSTA